MIATATRAVAGSSKAVRTVSVRGMASKAIVQRSNLWVYLLLSSEVTHASARLSASMPIMSRAAFHSSALRLGGFRTYLVERC